MVCGNEKRRTKGGVIATLVAAVLLVVGGSPASGQESSEENNGEEAAPLKGESADSTGTALRRSDRMDFDERLVKGQGAKSGAVYLFKRTPRKLPELVALRTSYRNRIIEPVLGQKIADQAPSKTPGPTKAEKAPSKAPEPAEAAPVKVRESRAAKRRRRRRELQKSRKRGNQGRRSSPPAKKAQ